MRYLNLLSAAALSSFITTVCAAAATFSPSAAQGIQYSVSIPASTTSAGSGPIYFQLSGPATYQWFALGIGTQMAGATIFVTYADGNGNVTISPRDGLGEFMPLFNADAKVTLLAGSGISNGRMIANVRYIAKAGLVDGKSTAAPWIASWRVGSALNSPSQSANLIQHDAHSQFTFNLAGAVIASDTNPFVLTATGTANSPIATQSGSSGSTEVISGTGSTLIVYEITHGVIMATCMVILFPTGALIMRLGGGVYLHGALQLFTLAALFVGFGVGVRLGQLSHYLYNTAHTYIGTIVVGLMIIQPFLGLLQHRRFKVVHKRTSWGFIHAWYGRGLIVTGIINGLLGLQLAANSPHGIVAYVIVAAIAVAVWWGIVVFTGVRKRKVKKDDGAYQLLGVGTKSAMAGQEGVDVKNLRPGRGQRGNMEWEEGREMMRGMGDGVDGRPGVPPRVGERDGMIGPEPDYEGGEIGGPEYPYPQGGGGRGVAPTAYEGGGGRYIGERGDGRGY